MGASYDHADATVSAKDAEPITPNDSTVFNVTRCLYIGASGNLTVTMASGNDRTFANVPVGWAPLQVTKVLSTGTSASSIVALY